MVDVIILSGHGRRYRRQFKDLKAIAVNTTDRDLTKFKKEVKQALKRYPNALVVIGDRTSKLVSLVDDLEPNRDIFMLRPDVVVITSYSDYPLSITNKLKKLGYRYIQDIVASHKGWEKDLARISEKVPIVILEHELDEEVVNKFPKRNIFKLEEPDYYLRKGELEFGITPEEFNNTILTPQERYVQLLTLHGGIAQGSEHYLGARKAFAEALRNNRNDLLEYFWNTDPESMRDLLKESKSFLETNISGDKDQINMLIELGFPREAIIYAGRTHFLNISTWFGRKHGLKSLGSPREIERQELMGAIEGDDLKRIKEIIREDTSLIKPIFWRSSRKGKLPIVRYLLPRLDEDDIREFAPDFSKFPVSTQRLIISLLPKDVIENIILPYYESPDNLASLVTIALIFERIQPDELTVEKALETVQELNNHYMQDVFMRLI